MCAATVYNPYAADRRFGSPIPLLDEEFDSFDELKAMPLYRSFSGDGDFGRF